MKPQISLQELYQIKKKKDSVKTISYDKIIELCHRRIRNIAGYGGLNTFYEIPGMMVGYPLYNIYDCTNYVVEALRKSGFLVQILPPPHVCVIYISWDPSELKPKVVQKAIAPPPTAPGNGPVVPGFQMPPRLITRNEFVPTKKKKHSF
jgi:hypothetical protein